LSNPSGTEKVPDRNQELRYFDNFDEPFDNNFLCCYFFFKKAGREVRHRGAQIDILSPGSPAHRRDRGSSLDKKK